MKSKTFNTILIILNIVVLAGQIWPAWAPPFARTVNLVFLTATLVYFLLKASKKG